MKDKIVIQNKLCATANKYLNYTNHEKFCTVYIKRIAVPTGFSIKEKSSISLLSKKFMTHSKNVLFTLEQKLSMLLHQTNPGKCTNYAEFEELLKAQGE